MQRGMYETGDCMSHCTTSVCNVYVRSHRVPTVSSEILNHIWNASAYRLNMQWSTCGTQRIKGLNGAAESSTKAAAHAKVEALSKRHCVHAVWSDWSFSSCRRCPNWGARGFTTVRFHLLQRMPAVWEVVWGRRDYTCGHSPPLGLL